ALAATTTATTATAATAPTALAIPSLTTATLTSTALATAATSVGVPRALGDVLEHVEELLVAEQRDVLPIGVHGFSAQLEVLIADHQAGGAVQLLGVHQPGRHALFDELVRVVGDVRADHEFHARDELPGAVLALRGAGVLERARGVDGVHADGAALQTELVRGQVLGVETDDVAAVTACPFLLRCVQRPKQAGIGDQELLGGGCGPLIGGRRAELREGIGRGVMRIELRDRPGAGVDGGHLLATRGGQGVDQYGGFRRRDGLDATSAASPAGAATPTAAVGGPLGPAELVGDEAPGEGGVVEDHLATVEGFFDRRGGGGEADLLGELAGIEAVHVPRAGVLAGVEGLDEVTDLGAVGVVVDRGQGDEPGRGRVDPAGGDGHRDGGGVRNAGRGGDGVGRAGVLGGLDGTPGRRGARACTAGARAARAGLLRAGLVGAVAAGCGVAGGVCARASAAWAERFGGLDGGCGGDGCRRRGADAAADPAAGAATGCGTVARIRKLLVIHWEPC